MLKKEQQKGGTSEIMTTLVPLSKHATIERCFQMISVNEKRCQVFNLFLVEDRLCGSSLRKANEKRLF